MCVLFCPAARTLFSCPACRSDSLVLWSGQDRTKIEMLSCRTGQDRTGRQDDRTSCPVLISVSNYMVQCPTNRELRDRDHFADLYPLITCTRMIIETE